MLKPFFLGPHRPSKLFQKKKRWAAWSIGPPNPVPHGCMLPGWREDILLHAGHVGINPKTVLGMGSSSISIDLLDFWSIPKFLHQFGRESSAKNEFWKKEPISIEIPRLSYGFWEVDDGWSPLLSPTYFHTTWDDPSPTMPVPTRIITIWNRDHYEPSLATASQRGGASQTIYQYIMSQLVPENRCWEESFPNKMWTCFSSFCY